MSFSSVFFLSLTKIPELINLNKESTQLYTLSVGNLRCFCWYDKIVARKVSIFGIVLHDIFLFWKKVLEIVISHVLDEIVFIFWIYFILSHSNNFQTVYFKYQTTSLFYNSEKTMY